MNYKEYNKEILIKEYSRYLLYNLIVPKDLEKDLRELLKLMRIV